MNFRQTEEKIILFLHQVITHNQLYISCSKHVWVKITELSRTSRLEIKLFIIFSDTGCHFEYNILHLLLVLRSEGRPMHFNTHFISQSEKDTI